MNYPFTEDTLPYQYFAKLDESTYPQGAYDGDTIDLIIDVGFKMTTRQRIRLLGVNTPELRGASKEEGLYFRDMTRLWLKDAKNNSDDEWYLKISTFKSDAFGRYLADVYRESVTNRSLGQYLIRIGCPRYES
ncbi:MAG: thermonuclease family protein [Flavobacteriaceae bacterium]